MGMMHACTLKAALQLINKGMLQTFYVITVSRLHFRYLDKLIGGMNMTVAIK